MVIDRGQRSAKKPVKQGRGEDPFSAGSVLYELSSGRLPFPGKTSAVVFDAILNREAVPPLSINLRFPRNCNASLANVWRRIVMSATRAPRNCAPI